MSYIVGHWTLLQELWNCWYWKISSWAQAQLSLCHSTAEANWELWLQIDKLGNDSLTDSRLEIITCLTSHKKIPSVLWGKDCAEWRIQKQNQSAELLYSSRCIFCWGGAVAFFIVFSQNNTHMLLKAKPFNKNRIILQCCWNIQTLTVRVCVYTHRSIPGLVPALQGAADSGVLADGHGMGEQVRSGTSGWQILHQTQQHCVHTGHTPTAAHTGNKMLQRLVKYSWPVSLTQLLFMKRVALISYWLGLWRVLATTSSWLPTRRLTSLGFYAIFHLFPLFSSCHSFWAVELASVVQRALDPETGPTAQDTHPVPDHSRDRTHPNMATQQWRWGIYIQNRCMRHKVTSFWPLSSLISIETSDDEPTFWLSELSFMYNCIGNSFSIRITSAKTFRFISSDMADDHYI